MNPSPDTRTRKKASWRAAMVTNPSVPPIYGVTVEVAENSLIVLADKEVKTGTVCHIYLDIPSVNLKQKNYISFTGDVNSSALIGQINMFRHLIQVKEISSVQRENLIKALKAL
ncbi:MAG: hypothetical protein RL571_1077 [Pseudomonadota bacterium]|jgi:hypothetical protein